MLKSILVIAMVGMLAACVSGKRPPETYVGKDGKATIIESDSEMCKRSCNDDYSRCMDKSAVVGNEAVDILDTGYWLTQASQDWFNGAAGRSSGRAQKQVLIVEDSAFFRQLLVPALSAAGFQASAVGSAEQALRLRDAGVMFDAILSDIEMPDMNGTDFVRAIRAAGPWAHLPVIALTSHTDPRDVEAGRDAGFTDYVAKSQREALVASLRQCLTDLVPV